MYCQKHKVFTEKDIEYLSNNQIETGVVSNELVNLMIVSSFFSYGLFPINH